jgi:short chain dehydrogenase
MSNSESKRPQGAGVQTMEEEPQVQSEPKPPYAKEKLEKPGIEAEMQQKPRWRAPRYKAAGKLQGKVALVTGADSGIGRSVAYLYAREGADVAIVHLPEEQRDADETRRAIEEEGRRCLDLPGDLTDPRFCREAVERAVAELGRLDVLVSNAAWQNRKESLEEVTEEEWHKAVPSSPPARRRA